MVSHVLVCVQLVRACPHLEVGVVCCHMAREWSPKRVRFMFPFVHIHHRVARMT